MENELAENPEKAFKGNGNKYKDQAKIADLERLLGQAHAEIELLEKAFAIGVQSTTIASGKLPIPLHYGI
jgi:hypothetical protein